MAAKRNVHTYRNAAYVSGNAAHKLKSERVLPKRSLDEARRPSVNNRIRRNREKALQMDLPYVILLTIAVVCTLYFCVKYLQLQSSITARIHSIGTLESELETLKTQNDALQTTINISVDLDHVYQVATEELGMVYANQSQILQYNKTEREYVRQNEDIPKN